MPAHAYRRRAREIQSLLLYLNIINMSDFKPTALLKRPSQGRLFSRTRSITALRCTDRCATAQGERI